MILNIQLIYIYIRPRGQAPVPGSKLRRALAAKERVCQIIMASIATIIISIVIIIVITIIVTVAITITTIHNNSNYNNDNNSYNYNSNSNA